MAGENPDFTLPGSLGPSGTEFIIMSQVLGSTAIPDNAQTAPITGAAVGTLLLKEVIIQMNGTGTGWAAAGPANYEITTDNANGLTGAAAPIILEARGTFTANSTFRASVDGDTKVLPIVLEDGKKLYIHGDNAAGADTGTADIYMVFQRLTAGAYIEKADVS